MPEGSRSVERHKRRAAEEEEEAGGGATTGQIKRAKEWRSEKRKRVKRKEIHRGPWSEGNASAKKTASFPTRRLAEHGNNMWHGHFYGRGRDQPPIHDL